MPTSPLNYPGAIAVDGSGDVYIADSGNNRIVAETISSGSYSERVVQTSTLNYPEAIAVDGNNNIYVADTYNNRVLKETASFGLHREHGDDKHAEQTSGLTVDGNGNIVISDTYNNRVLKEDLADLPTLSFAPTAPGSTSSDSPRTVTIQNSGNAALSFPVPTSGSNPSLPEYFTLNSGGTSACPLVTAEYQLRNRSRPASIVCSQSALPRHPRCIQQRDGAHR